jgi:hypothetical protein
VDDFQRHKVRLWTVLPANLGFMGRADVGVMYGYDSPLTYSIFATGVARTAEQSARNPGYARPFASQTLYFGDRGIGEFESRHQLDLAVSYQIPIWRTLGPWFKVDVFNVLNNQPLLRYNTTVTPDFDGPRDEFGLPLEYVPGGNFGQATTTTHDPRPRTVWLAFGFRF